MALSPPPLGPPPAQDVNALTLEALHERVMSPLLHPLAPAPNEPPRSQEQEKAKW